MEDHVRYDVTEPKDDIFMKVRLNVTNFYVKLNHTKFLDWIMSTNDYFN